MKTKVVYRSLMRSSAQEDGIVSVDGITTLAIGATVDVGWLVTRI